MQLQLNIKYVWMAIAVIAVAAISPCSTAPKSKQGKAEIEAQTAIIRAKGEAEAIRVRGRAVQANPGLVQLQIVEKWNGISPLVVGGGSGANILLPIGNLKIQ